MSKKHIFLSCANNDNVDLKTLNSLREQLIQKRLRIYQPQQNENINTSIANGVENAALVIIFPSPAFQQSKDCFKILNYADQKKTPILAVNHILTFKPIGWLGVILAAYKSCKCTIEDVMTMMKTMQIKMDQVVLKDGETNGVYIDESNPFFHGSTKTGNLVATYTQGGKAVPMDLEFFGMKNNQIYGQGGDVVGDFTIAGSYEIQSQKGKLEFQKSYIGKHTVGYSGEITVSNGKCSINGYWTIGTNLKDKFNLEFSLSQKEPTGITVNAPTSRRGATKVMLSYAACHLQLAQKIADGLNRDGIATICPELDANVMIKEAAQNAVAVVPLLSQAYEDSDICKKVLNFADRAGIPIVPVIVQDSYTLSGWVGVIFAGALWIKITNADDFEKKRSELIVALSRYRASEEKQAGNALECTTALGYYVQNNTKCDMTFNMFAMLNGLIAGEGDDVVGAFIIHGKYKAKDKTDDFIVDFQKHYIGKHDVIYTGTTSHNDSHIFIDGKWKINTISDSFHLELPRSPSSKSSKTHVMLSYQWNSQTLVKKVAHILKEKNISIWFDIAGDMKGNINTAMADGIENAAVVVSFATDAYSKSANCQKELGYATQLGKQVIPVVLESEKRFQNTWLGTIISKFDKLDLEDEKQMNKKVDELVARINSILKVESKDESDSSKPSKPEVSTKFEGGAVTGKYYQYNSGHDMKFEFFSLRKGRVAGQGDDEIGAFTMAGNYDESGQVNFTKQYIGKHSVNYKGILKCDLNGGFRIEGEWSIGTAHDKFFLENVRTKDK